MSNSTPKRRASEFRYITLHSSLALVGLCLLFFYSGLQTSLGYWLGDRINKLLISDQATSYTIIAIDQRSVEQLGNSPWSRDTYTSAINTLRAANIDSLYIDLDFSSPSEPAVDKRLQESIYELAKISRVYAPAELRANKTVHKDRWLKTADLFNGTTVTKVSVNTSPGTDGLIREITSGFNYRGMQYPSAASALAASRPRATVIDYTISPSSFDYISFVDLVNGEIRAEQLQGRKLLLGTTDPELANSLPVPIYQSLPSVVVQALAAETLERGGIQNADNWKVAAVTCVILWLICLPFKQAGWHIILAASAILFFSASLATLMINIAFRTELNYATPAIFLAIQFGIYTLSKLQLSTLDNLRLHFGIQQRDSILRAIFEKSHDYMFCADDNGKIRYVSNSLCTLTGKSPSDIKGRSGETFIANYQALYDKAINNETAEALRCDVITANGDIIPSELTFNPIETPGGDYHAVIVRDLSAQLQREQELRHQSLHDKLTGLPNRKSLVERIDSAMQEQSELTLFLLSLNHFKEINDLYGHCCGDEVLTAFSDRLQAHFTRGADCFRQDGAVFALVFPKRISCSEINELAELLQYMTKKPISIDNYTVELDVSIGVAISSDYIAVDSKELLSQADIALQNCKETHTLYTVFDTKLKNQQVAFVEIIPMLRRAIESEQLCIHFQPKVDLQTGEVIGSEMLTRWTTEDGESISPELFIKIAENSQLMESLMFSLLFKLIDLESDWVERGLPKKVAVNLSSRLLSNPSFITEMISCVDTLLGNIEIEFEITETALMANPCVALRSIAMIKRSGYSIAIDDFGVGYSSLAYIRDLGADTLKIDKSFIDDITDSEDSEVIVRSTIGMAHELNLKVVAEGVESEAQAAHLQSLNCDYGQGYLYAKAMSFKDFADWHDSFEPNEAQQSVLQLKLG